MSSSISIVNPRADIISRSNAIAANANAARGLQQVLKSNLGPRGTLKMLVGGGGQLKLTKDGNVLLGEMQIQHPTASMIARAASALDSIVGDGSSSNVIIIGEMMKLGEKLITDNNIHPHILCAGIDIARKRLLEFLELHKNNMQSPGRAGSEFVSGLIRSIYKHHDKADGFVENMDREILKCVCSSSLASKLHAKLAKLFTDIVLDAVLIVYKNPEENKEGGRREAVGTIDPFMIELVEMKCDHDTNSRLVRGMVLDHGGRHPDMPSRLEDCYILTLNVSLEYEKSEVNSSFAYSTTQQREALVNAERNYSESKVRRIIELKERVCGTGSGVSFDRDGSTITSKATDSSGAPFDGKPRSFVVLNQKGIDPPALDLLAKAGILALRRVKRRNMERLTLCCGGSAVNCVDDKQDCGGLTAADLGYAGLVYQESIGEDKFTFVEHVGVRPKGVGKVEPHASKSCCILIKGQNSLTIAAIKDAIRDGIRAVKNAIDDGCVVAGAGAFELACYNYLMWYKHKYLTGVSHDADDVGGKKQYGLDIVAEGLLAIPKTLAENSGFDVQQTILDLLEQSRKMGGGYGGYQPPGTKAEGCVCLGLDLYSGAAMNPLVDGVYDSYGVKRQELSISTSLTQNLLLVD